ncbi:TolC family protein [Usitatibacter palustris]|uniref:Outer membrane protein TolC n=1 Tax=Usitatibacter palustris TaxID=2732487 RepID=A0A6M4HDH2_9PROT|nr:TolC family protein [Usitatibacter palustris]QJR16553.1 hypothetical protein DSM104440_03388 [Usitatibacter palustris]
MLHARILSALALAALPLASHAQVLSFAEAQRLALQDAPQVTARAAAVRAANESAVGAAELPDPKLIAAIENMPVEGADKFSLTREAMTMRKIGVMQDFPGGDKLRLRNERAQAEVQREVAMLEATRISVRRDAALAWFDVWFAERQVVALRALESEAALQVEAAQAALAGGRGQAGDPFAARLATAQLADRVTEARRNVARARAQLARWVGPAAATRELGDAPDFGSPRARQLVTNADLASHPHIAAYAPAQAAAQADVRLAEAEKDPNWSLEVTYAQRGPAYTNMMSIGVRLDLPIFETKRQNPAIAAKVAAAEQVRAQAEDAMRAVAAEFGALLADWDAAQERAQRYEAVQAPLARDRVAAALAAYRGGKGDLPQVLDARKGEVEVRLGQLQAESEQARAWAQLAFHWIAHPKE